MSKNKTNALGIIQSRGLGDIVIALPIAHHYHQEGYDISWPICEEFIPHFEQHVPWVQWIPVATDTTGNYFYRTPEQLLNQAGVKEHLPLYQALTSYRFHEELYFQHTKFDQYKYIRASVPFLKKWCLADAITRATDKEQELYNRLVKNPLYAVVHLEGSDHRAEFDPSTIPDDWQTIYITEGETPSIFNWLKILEGAQAIVAVDSCIANLVDQMRIDTDLYFIPRSHIGLTPVQGMDWTWVKFD